MFTVKRGNLRSWPFISLYGAAVSAIILNYERERWGSTSWFPVAVGLTASLAIVAIIYLLDAILNDPSASRWWREGFFLVIGKLPLVAIPFLGREDLLLICGLLMMSAMFWYASMGMLFQWPGFRAPAVRKHCEHCGYGLTSDDPSICLACGMQIEWNDGDSDGADA